jgi:hypothetical protein
MLQAETPHWLTHRRVHSFFAFPRCYTNCPACLVGKLLGYYDLGCASGSPVGAKLDYTGS